MTGLLSGATIYALADRPLAAQMRFHQAARSGGSFAGVLAGEMRSNATVQAAATADQRSAFAGAIGAMAVAPLAERRGAALRRKLAAYRRVAAVKL
ncbi:hypothetical protein ACFSM5_06055 [Lacibacterium aquatile]|uniref:Uncharacterized protein n=1 Tax=Lacibacterium aquatile TaxID=1168082 RepID=A0ABW5DNW1_9PROT